MMRIEVEMGERVEGDWEIKNETLKHCTLILNHSDTLVDRLRDMLHTLTKTYMNTIQEQR